MSESMRSFLDFAVETAYLAGRLTLGYYQTGLRPEFKADESPVTVADRKSEELSRARIEGQYRHHAIVGEEYGGEESGQASQQVVEIQGIHLFDSRAPAVWQTAPSPRGLMFGT